MVNLISGLIILYVCVYLPLKTNKRYYSMKRRETYNNLNKQSVDEMEKWRR